MEPNTYRISELAEKAGVTKRTVHYYVSRGLLPPASGEGLASAYGDAHLWRLRYIRMQQEAYLPLDEIRKRLSAMSDGEIRRVAESGGEQDSPSGKEASKHAGAPGAHARYERVALGLGLELHVPLGVKRAETIAESIVEYAKKLVKEG